MHDPPGGYTVPSTPELDTRIVLSGKVVPGAAVPADAPHPARAVVGFECSLDTTSADVLETVVRAVSRETVDRWADELPGTTEVALLSTCHRLEVYLVARGAAPRLAWRDRLPGPASIWTVREGAEAIHHLFRVAAGRESSALGETEVRGQVLSAGRAAIVHGPRPILRELFQAAASAAEEVAGGLAPGASIASIAAGLLRERIASANPRVLVVGTGVVGRQVARDLSPFARVTVLYHLHPPDPGFLRAEGVEALPISRLVDAARDADAIVTAAKLGDRGLRPDHLPPDRPLLLVDLGMPRNIDPAVRALPQVRLIDLEELRARARVAARPDRVDGAIRDRAAACAARLATDLDLDWVDARLRSVESTRQAEVETARAFLGPLDPAQAAAVDRLTRRLVARLVVPPLDRIRTLPPGPEGDLRRTIARELLGVSDPEP